MFFLAHLGWLQSKLPLGDTKVDLDQPLSLVLLNSPLDFYSLLDCLNTISASCNISGNTLLVFICAAT